LLNELVTTGLVEIVELDESASVQFERLVVGPAVMTLDDGEAATIAYALANEMIAVIDERKATRICAELFANVRVGCTIDILAHDDVRNSLGDGRLVDAVFNAVQHRRMRILPQHVQLVLELIGPAKAPFARAFQDQFGSAQQNAPEATLPRERGICAMRHREIALAIRRNTPVLGQG
jgi:predicted nucleic acid-binding protein